MVTLLCPHKKYQGAEGNCRIMDRGLAGEVGALGFSLSFILVTRSS